jgi:hypothetical protein
MANRQAGNTRKIPIDQWIELYANPQVRNCILIDGILYDKITQKCTTPDKCPYRISEGSECRKYGPPQGSNSGVRKVIEADPHEETKGDLKPVEDPNASQPITSLVPIVQTATPEDCANGGKQFYRGSYCFYEKACPYKTLVTFPKSVKKDGKIDKKDLPKCVAHCIEDCMFNDKKTLFMGSPPCCIATGIAECEYQDKETSEFLGDVKLDFCNKYAV